MFPNISDIEGYDASQTRLSGERLFKSSATASVYTFVQLHTPNPDTIITAMYKTQIITGKCGWTSTMFDIL